MIKCKSLISNQKNKELTNTRNCFLYIPTNLINTWQGQLRKIRTKLQIPVISNNKEYLTTDEKRFNLNLEENTLLN